MGLDGVELVMAVEEEFQIAISDSEANECSTVRKLGGVPGTVYKTTGHLIYCLDVSGISARFDQPCADGAVFCLNSVDKN